ncbi:S-formylglutathione hydrolase isoform X2 [Hyalella azteca]|uniref:S-formylglutathione hydrolase n=1 Tax=Hyalella azteca TaxID=294128 RepID=A0A979FXR6_HYAAZ|nr:S-formylglutathione hydrolase isoform X2 [Hyalella azteca]
MKLFSYNTMSESLKLESTAKCFGGSQNVYSHESTELKCNMKFAVFVPPQHAEDAVPVVYWLSGLTCTEQNFITKAGAQQHAALHGLLIVCPDTSPRDCKIEGEDADYDFGTGAGFYVDATAEPWKTNYRMYSYVTQELPVLIAANFNIIPGKTGIMGHSMGGHGALVCALKKTGQYQSVSAFAPICHPSVSPWGIKAFKGYLGPNEDTWQEYDACALVKKYSGPPLQILIDQGTEDNFYTQKQLLPEDLVRASQESRGVSVVLRMQQEYDHSYYFIATFIASHLEHHAKYLKA